MCLLFAVSIYLLIYRCIAWQDYDSSLTFHAHLMHPLCNSRSAPAVTACISRSLKLLYTFLPSSPVPTGPPQGLAVASRTTTSITVTWGNPAPDRINDRDNVTGFVVRRDGVPVATVTVRTYNFTGLTVATSYRLEVLAVNDQGTAPNNHAARVTATTASGGNIICTLTPIKN